MGQNANDMHPCHQSASRSLERGRIIRNGRPQKLVVTTLCEPSAHTVHLPSVTIPRILAGPHLMLS
jgi:hypothetical protein